MNKKQQNKPPFKDQYQFEQFLDFMKGIYEDMRAGKFDELIKELEAQDEEIDALTEAYFKKWEERFKEDVPQTPQPPKFESM